MQTISRRPQESILIGTDIRVTVVDISDDTVSLVIEMPDDVAVELGEDRQLRLVTGEEVVVAAR